MANGISNSASLPLRGVAALFDTDVDTVSANIDAAIMSSGHPMLIEGGHLLHGVFRASHYLNKLSRGSKTTQSKAPNNKPVSSQFHPDEIPVVNPATPEITTLNQTIRAEKLDSTTPVINGDKRNVSAGNNDKVSDAGDSVVKRNPPGTRRNSAGQLVDTQTGKFVKDPNSAAAQGKLTPTQQLRFDQQADFNKNSKSIIDKDAACPYCQSKQQEATDHIVSVQRAQQAIESGTISRKEALELLPSKNNLIGSCTTCNSSKGGKQLATDPNNVQPGQWPAPNPSLEALEKAKEAERKLIK